MKKTIIASLFMICIAWYSNAQQTCENEMIPPEITVVTGNIAIDLSATGSIELNAADFVQDASDNCSDITELRFSFSPDPADSVITWNCDQILALETDLGLNVYAIDLAGNTDFEMFRFRISDPMSVCSISVTERTISGSISGIGAAQPIMDSVTYNVTVPVSGIAVTLVDVQTCATQPQNGYQICMAYNTAVFEADSRLHLEMKRTDWAVNGVSTLDLVLIIRHILGINNFDAASDYYAADVGLSQSVSTLDLVDIRKVILNIDLDFRSDLSWRFIRDEILEEAEPFPNFQYNLNTPGEDYYYSEEDTPNITELNFTAIKLGDVNGTNAG